MKTSGFTRTIDDGYLFHVYEGDDKVAYKALRNIAGFSHRDWECWRWEPTLDRWVMVEDQLTSRREAVEVAEDDAPTRIRAARNRARNEQKVGA